MSSLNKAMLIGRLGQDPDVRNTQGGTVVANMSLATSNRYKDSNGEWKEQTEWHRVVAWGKIGEVARDYLKKGSQVYVEGPIQTRKWEDKEGRDRYTTEVKALTLTMLDSKSDGQGNGGGQANNSGQGSKPMGSQVDLNEDFDDLDDDLPF